MERMFGGFWLDLLLGCHCFDQHVAQQREVFAGWHQNLLTLRNLDNDFFEHLQLMCMCSGVCLELYTGQPPFADFREPTVIVKVSDGMRPKRPTCDLTMSDAL